MFKYVLSAHAEMVVKERSIHSEWLERILERPEKTENDKTDPKLTHTPWVEYRSTATAYFGWSIIRLLIRLPS
jgi:hypothetical protein